MEKKDVKNIFICQYENNRVGLFKKIDYFQRSKRPVLFGEELFDAGSVYVGIDSSYVGIKTTRYMNENENYYEKAGTIVRNDEKKYIANCNLNAEMSFDDMRLIMYKNGEIQEYVPGEATTKEMLDVLSFAIDYYQIEQCKTKKK